MQQRFQWVVLLAFLLALPGGFSLADPGDEAYLEFSSLLLDDQGGIEGLNGANSAVVSPDGQFVYVASHRDNALIQYQRDPANGRLSQQSIRRAGLGEDGTLDGIFALELSPSGNQLYALTANRKLLVFERDDSSGNLTLMQTLADQQDGVQGLSSTVDLALSADGRHLYVIGGSSGFLTTFERNLVDGTLTYLSVLIGRIEVPGSDSPVNVFDRASRITSSSDGSFLYLASFIGGLTTFARDSQTGALQVVQRLSFQDDIGLPWEIGFSPGEEHAYVVDVSGQFPEDPREPPGIRIFQRDASTGFLTRIGECCAEATGPPILESGVSLQFHPDGRQVYAVGFHESRVSRFLRDNATGLLEWQGEVSGASSGSPRLLGASRMAMAPAGDYLYVPSDIDDSLTVIETAAPSGPMAVTQLLIDGEGAQVGGLDRPNSLVVSGDGRFVYATSGSDSSVSVQEVSPDGRSLAQVQMFDPDEDDELLGFLRSLVLSPDNRFAYVRASSIGIYTRDEASGALSFQERVGGNQFHRSIAISPLGDRFYAGISGSPEPGLRTYARDISTGRLNEIDTLVEFDSGEDFPEFFDRPNEIGVSPDGRHIYVVDRRHPLLAFARPEEGDSPDFVQRVDPNVVPREFGFSTPTAIAFDPSGRYLYVVASRGGVIVFRRDGDSGRLTFVENHEDEPEETFPSFDPSAIAVSPDGYHVYVTDEWEDALLVFVRNPISGRLTLLGKRRTGVSGVDGLLNPEALAVSADGENIFVGTEVGGILTFTKRDLICQPGLEKLCLNQGRFHVEVDWRTRREITGPGKSVPVGSDDSGLFWFFNPSNWEMLVKVLDGCGVDESFWVFSAATTNVEYTLNVTDSLTGLQQTFFNPLGAAAPAIAATGVFPACPAGEQGQPAVSSKVAQSSPPPLAHASDAGSTCAGSNAALCLFQDRFRVEVDWRTRNGNTGQGQAVEAGSDNSGLLWFFNQQNWEMLVKVIDGCSSNGHFWVFSAATTNVEYTLRVTDTETGAMKEYFNALDSNARAITDTEAFGGC